MSRSYNGGWDRARTDEPSLAAGATWEGWCRIQTPQYQLVLKSIWEVRDDVETGRRRGAVWPRGRFAEVARLRCAIHAFTCASIS